MKWLACILLGLAVSVAAQDTADVDACIANATAVTSADTAVSDSLSNAVAQAISQVVQCGESRVADPKGVSGISIAVALAISETRNVGEECVADASADADVVPSLVANRVTGDLAAGLLGQLEGKHGDRVL